MPTQAQENSVTDPLDQAIVRALQMSPRIAFSALGELLDVSEQTVARRYRRLHRAGLLRVTVLVDAEALGENSWLVRVDCRPTGAASLARALAQRDDVAWVSLLAGGTQVLCTVRSRTAAAREELLLERLPRTAPVLGMSAAMVLHRFVGGSSDDWSGLGSALTVGQEQSVRDTVDPEWHANGAAVPTLDAADTALLEALAADGRAPVATLAGVCGLSEGRTARRLRALFGSHVAYFDIDAPAEAFGFHTQAVLWLTVSPAHLDAAGRELASRTEVPFAAAITGTHNLHVAAVCRDVPSLYRFVTERVGTIPGVTAMEVAPTLRMVKQAGSLLRDGRLTSASDGRQRQKVVT